MSDFLRLTWAHFQNYEDGEPDVSRTAVLSTQCECEYDCECFENGTNEVKDLLNLWASGFCFEGIDDVPKVRIDGKHMGWTSASGWIVVQGSDVLDALKLDRADYTLKFELSNDWVTVSRSSHDEPTGASFQLWALPLDTEE